jgi:hypothetical protein
MFFLKARENNLNKKYLKSDGCSLNMYKLLRFIKLYIPEAPYFIHFSSLHDKIYTNT